MRCFCKDSSDARVSLLHGSAPSSSTCDIYLPLLVSTRDCIPQSGCSLIQGHPAKYATSAATSPLCASTTSNRSLSWTNFQPAEHNVVALLMLLLISATKPRRRALRCFTYPVRQSCNATQRPMHKLPSGHACRPPCHSQHDTEIHPNSAHTWS